MTRPYVSAGVRVRFRPRELADTPDVQLYEQAIQAEVTDDNTLMLQDEHGRVVGMVHRDRWEAFELVPADEPADE